MSEPESATPPPEVPPSSAGPANAPVPAPGPVPAATGASPVAGDLAGVEPTGPVTDAPAAPAAATAAFSASAAPLATAATILAAAALAARFALPLGTGATDALACSSCRACDATGDLCPAEIPFISEMVIAAHTGDLDRFLRNRGLLCVRCENCSAYCPANLDLTRLFGVAHAQATRALESDSLPRPLVDVCLEGGWLGPTFFPAFRQGRAGKGG